MKEIRVVGRRRMELELSMQDKGGDHFLLQRVLKIFTTCNRYQQELTFTPAIWFSTITAQNDNTASRYSEYF